MKMYLMRQLLKIITIYNVRFRSTNIEACCHNFSTPRVRKNVKTPYKKNFIQSCKYYIKQ
ncbi:unnamed protein product [Callosobruchus maculatus]|uniref:Uncharacterized protein n=1 Tax=Callosobruchus maculatus TaxID=64391 RepID=A0A653CZ55_CALMS|nr:unnamed protein product [Callosobruchus maculatus]